ncbi:MAG: sodium:solute symporter [Acidobacteriota bacterium]
MSIIDWIIFVAYLALTVFIGLFKSRRGKNIEAYYLGNRSIPWWAVGLSVMATQASAITFIGTTGQAFDDGLRFIQIYLPLPFVVIILCLTFAPFFYRARVYTAYEYLERRFDTKTRALTSFLFQCSRGMSVGIVIYAPSVVLSIMLGWNETTTILIMGATTLLYTALGGVRAVVWTDTMQMILMFIGLFAGLYLVINAIPSGVTFSDAVYLGGVADRWNAIDTTINPSNQYTLLSGLVGGFFLQLSYFGSDQSQVQRYITASSIKESRMSLVMTAILKVPMQFLILATGVFLFVFYQFERPPAFFNPAEIRRVEESSSSGAFHQSRQQFDAAFDHRKAMGERLIEARRRGDPAEAERLLADFNNADKEVKAARKKIVDIIKATPGSNANDVNYVFPSFILKYVPLGLVGLMISVIFAAAMSSISGEIAALSSATMVDFYKRFVKPQASDIHYLRASQVCTIFWGAFATFIAMFAGRWGTSLVETVNKVGSHFYGPILGVFLLAFLVKRSNGTGAFAGAIAGLAAVLLTSYGLEISWLYLNAIGPVVVIVVGTAVSLLTRQRLAKDE